MRLRITAETKFSFLSVAATFFLILIFASPVLAQTITGTVKNGTVGKPSAGDDVILLKLAQGMEEAGRTKTDAQGKFTLKMDDSSSPHLIRVVHDGVTYHRMAPPGTPSVDIDVYDASKKVEGVSLTADVLRFQSDNGQLQGIRLFAVNNSSKPPRTQMNDQNFEFYLPDGAQVDTGLAKSPGGQPITSAPVPQKEKNLYAFIFPLRPGDTQFQVVYHMPYSGSLNVTPKMVWPPQHFVVVLPKSMQFEGKSGVFQPVQDPQDPNAAVQVSNAPKSSEDLAFKISGNGVLDKEQDAGGGAGGAPAAGAQGRDSRPGGGLGPPIDAPDPLEKYRWYVLGGFGAALLAGAIYIAKRPRAAATYTATGGGVVEPWIAGSSAAAAAPRGGILLEALKEELFQLEVEHKQGKMSDDEYATARSALDQTLSRAIKRESEKGITT